MEKSKLSEKEIEERKKAARDAEILASLDNNEKHSESFKILKEKWINGEISYEEYVKKVIDL